MERQSTVSKALHVLRAVARHPEGVGVSELAREVDAPASTVHRLLQDLVATDFVQQDQGRRTYGLGLTVYELAQQVSEQRGFTTVARPLLQALTDATGFHTLLATRHDAELVYLERVHAPGVLQVRGLAGQRSALHATAMGKVMLAALDDDELSKVLELMRLEPFTAHTITERDELLAELAAVRARGWAVSEQEHEEGIVSLAVPVHNGHEVIASLCAATPLVAGHTPDLMGVLDEVRETAREVGLRLPRWSAP